MEEKKDNSIQAYLKENLPTYLLDTMIHCGYWCAGTNEDIVIKNPNYKSQKDKSKEMAIYCVHGTADYNKSFYRLVTKLMKTLPSHISSLRLLAFEGRFEGRKIEDFSKELQEKIQENKHKTVILMGHSRGGLVCAYFETVLAKKIGVKVDTVFTMGTPFYGSDWAMPPFTWFSGSVKQMEVAAAWLIALQEGVKVSKAKYVFFAADKDPIVRLESCYIHERIADLIVLDRHDHLSMMSSGRMAERILERLRGETFELSLQSAYKELKTYIDKFQKRAHLFDATSKLNTLNKLLTFLESKIISPKLSEQESNSVGDLMHNFLLTENQYAILNGALVNPLSTSNTSTYSFIVLLRNKYKKVPIVKEALQVEVLTEEVEREGGLFASI